MKKSITKKEPFHMKYFTYKFLLSLLDEELENELNIYNEAYKMIGDLKLEEDESGFPITRTYEPYGKDKRAADQLHTSFRIKSSLIENMKIQLKFAYSKSAHPNMIKEKGFFPTYL